MKHVLLTFDIEELSFVSQNNKNLDDLFEIGRRGTETILDILNQKGIRATFFVTMEFAKRFPSVIGRLINEGHELASHGLSHSHNYKTLSDFAVSGYLDKIKDFFLSEFNADIVGFRAPRLESPKAKLLKNAGFIYESSLHPTWVPGHYNNFFKSRKIISESGIISLPISVTAGLRFPFSWFWFRNFGINYAKICTKLSIINSNYINLYFHPWDFVDLKTCKFRVQIPFLFKRNSGGKFIGSFSRYLDWCLENGFRYSTVREFLGL